MESIIRNNNLYLCFQLSGSKFEGFRLGHFYELEDGVYNLSLNPDYLENAYDHDILCDIDIDLMLRLRPGLQTWLYGFMNAYPDMAKLPIDMLHDLSGSNYRNQNDFKKAVKAALAVLYQRGVIDWSHGVARDGMVFWEKKLILPKAC